jgi:hypothetical protein
MPNIFSGLGKARKVKEFVLEMDNYHDVHMSKVDNKITIGFVF